MPEERSGSTIDDRREGGRAPRVGLVCGGGGILGGAWLVGALHALNQAGWDPQRADYIVGTSAGSVVGSLIASGIPTDFMTHHQLGGDVEGLTDANGEQIEPADVGSERLFKWSGRFPRPVLGSPGLAARIALRPWRYPPATALTALIGRGFLSTEQIGRIIRRIVPKGWSPHPNLWVVALEYRTGKRVVFGSPGAPETDLALAVQASCAIPGLYAPVQIGSRSYVDGGAWSASNLDVLQEADVDVVIALNPMSSLQPGLPHSVLERFERRIRARTGRRLGHEARRIRETGRSVLLIQPREPDLIAMGVNLMDPTRREHVLRTSMDTVARRLKERDAQAVLTGLGASAR